MIEAPPPCPRQWPPVPMLLVGLRPQMIASARPQPCRALQRSFLLLSRRPSWTSCLRHRCHCSRGPSCTGSIKVLFFLATISSRTCCQQRSGAPSASSSTHWLLLALPCCAEHLPLPRCLGHVRAAAASLKGRFRVRHVGRVDEIAEMCIHVSGASLNFAVSRVCVRVSLSV